MGRIVTQVQLQNTQQLECKLEFSALVDTGAAYLTLPRAWRSQLGEVLDSEEVELQTATNQKVTGELCGPVRITIAGFRPIRTDVLFIDMEPDEDNFYEPLLGYIPLEQTNVAVDMLGHRLVPVKYIDLK